MQTPTRTSPPARSRGVALAGAAAAFAITAAIVAAVVTGMAVPSEQAIARHASPAPARLAAGSGAAPIEVTIHPSSIHVVGIVVERTAESRPERARS
ncbi:MAG: hypothetical protein IT520_18435 [Burkholderiales bacterium]|nr:hypothetical protein [Burkholderiales bacterium]